MRELKTLEVDKWVPSDRTGMLKHAGMISPREAFDALKAHLEKAGLLPEDYFSEGSWRYEYKSQLPDYRQANCCVNWGGNEGIYLDISLLYEENGKLKQMNFATGKTLGESGDDFLRMSRIAAECSMMLNGRGQIVRFLEEEKNLFSQLSEDLKKAAAIEYKGIVFDEWSVDEETQGIYGEMCQDCAEKYQDALSDELSEGGIGACSVHGCDVVGMDSDNEHHYYVDFKLDLIKPLTKEQLMERFPEHESLEDQISEAAMLLDDSDDYEEPDRSNWERY